MISPNVWLLGLRHPTPATASMLLHPLLLCTCSEPQFLTGHSVSTVFYSQHHRHHHQQQRRPAPTSRTPCTVGLASQEPANGQDFLFHTATWGGKVTFPRSHCKNQELDLSLSTSRALIPNPRLCWVQCDCCALHDNADHICQPKRLLCGLL